MTTDHHRVLVDVTAGGQSLPAAVLGALKEVRVDQSLNIPDAFTLRFFDADGDLLDNQSFALGASLTITVDTGGVAKKLMEGEITGLCAEFDVLGTQELVVTGLDGRHRLARGVKVRTYLNQSDSTVVAGIAREHELKVQTDPTSKMHEYLLQSSTDYQFISERARACGYDWWMDAGVLHFGRPQPTGGSPTAKWGEELRRFRLRLSSSESAKDAEARGWDPVQQRALESVVPFDDGDLATDASWAVKQSRGGKNAFPAKRLAWGATVADGEEAKTLAGAMARRMASEQAVAKGEVLGNPVLRPGITLKLTGLGTSLCGGYRLTRVEHVILSGEPYVTRFESGGDSGHDLVDLLGGTGPSSPGPEARPLGGSLLVGVVTNKNDPDKLGRVKVKFLGVGALIESAWARVVSIGAGTDRGLAVVPDIDDEVLVGFEHGDVRRPLVLGGLWSTQQANPKHTSGGAKDGAVWRTKKGHVLSMSDGDGAESYARIALRTDKTALRMGEDATSLDAEGDITVSGQKRLTLKAGTDITIEGVNITVKAKGKLVLEGGSGVDVKSNGPVKVEGVNVEAAAKMTASLKGNLMAEISGAQVKIN